MTSRRTLSLAVTTAPDPWVDAGWLFEQWLLFVSTTIVTSRLLFPSEDARTGSGAPFVFLSLLALPVLVLYQWRSSRPLDPGRMDRVVILWVVVLGWLWLSALTARYSFPAQQQAWEWLGVFAIFWVLRQTPAPRAFASVMVLVVALALAQSLQALWQVGFAYPQMRKQFERRDPEMLHQLRTIGIEPGTPLEDRFRDRLYANEASGAFGHPNSLAGFLVLALPFAVALATTTGPRSSWLVRGGWLFVTIAMVGGLLVTRSRSAWLAALASLVLQAAWHWRHGVRWRKLAVALGVATAGLVVASFVLIRMSVFDRLILTESLKSFSYRLEWWQGSLGVLSEAPLLGVGYGSFQSHYLKHKLPFSSEEIEDPHNFLLELACNAGIPAAAAYVMLVIAVWGRVWRRAWGNEAEPKFGKRPLAAKAEEPAVALPVVWWLGVLAGGAGAWILALADEATLGCFLVGVLAVGLAALATRDLLQMSFLAPAGCAVAALHLHWLVSGGVGFPALLLPLWALSGAALAASTPFGHGSFVTMPSTPALVGNGTRRSWLTGAAFGTVLALAIAVIWLHAHGVLFPLFRREQMLARVRSMGVDGDRVVRAYESAAHLLPEDASTWVALAHLRFQRLQAARDPDRARQELDAATAALARAIELEPRRSSHFRLLGSIYQRAVEQAVPAVTYQQAKEAYRRAVDEYPNSATLQWEYADVLRLSGDVAKSVAHFQRALDLDQTPHVDKKLTQEQRRIALQRVTAASSMTPIGTGSLPGGGQVQDRRN